MQLMKCDFGRLRIDADNSDSAFILIELVLEIFL